MARRVRAPKAPEPGPKAPARARKSRPAAEPALPAVAATTVPEPAGGLYDGLWRSGLLNLGAITRRELSTYFVSPIGYVVATVLILLVSVVGYLGPLYIGIAVSMGNIFSLIAFFLIFFGPLYTMRLLAEERRQGTLEMLLTSPIRDWELVVGKWLGATVFYLCTIAFTLVYVLLVALQTQSRAVYHPFGAELTLPDLDYGAIITGYLGLLLLGAAFSAIGLLASSLTQNQIVAAFAGIGALLTLYYVFGFMVSFTPKPYSAFFDYVNASNRVMGFNQGRIVLKDVVYFVTISAGALFATTRILESRHWK